MPLLRPMISATSTIFQISARPDRAAARSGLALIWKIVLVAEIMGRSSGIGFQIQIYFQLFDVTRILAYSMAFIVVVQIIEWGILQPLERRAARGRK